LLRNQFKKHHRPGLLLIYTVLLLAILIPFKPALADAPACQDVATCQTPALPSHLQTTLIWWDENKVNQIDADIFSAASNLFTNPYNTCGPTTLSMLVNYIYYLRDPNTSRKVTTVEVMQAAQQLGFYGSADRDGTLGLNDVRKIAKQFGLQQKYPHEGTTLMSFDTFIRDLQKGIPAIAGMRYAYDKKTGDYQPDFSSKPINHFIVVIGINDDGQHFWVLNSHPGLKQKLDKEVRLEMLSFDDFKAAWMQNDDSKLKNYGNAIFLQ
jgi:hypothetical protein